MAGSIAGGKKASETNRRLYGEDFYIKVGAIGGSKGKKDGTIKGFALMSAEKLAAAGRKGGTISRRGPTQIIKAKGHWWDVKR